MAHPILRVPKQSTELWIISRVWNDGSSKNNKYLYRKVDKEKQVLDVPSESHFVDDNQINVYISTACLPHNKHITHAIL